MRTLGTFLVLWLACTAPVFFVAKIVRDVRAVNAAAERRVPICPSEKYETGLRAITPDNEPINITLTRSRVSCVWA